MQDQSNIQQNSPAQKGSHLDSKQAEAQTAQPSAPVMSDREGNATTENLTQTAAEDREVTPEFGDAADPASEEMGLHHRDEG